MGHARWRLALGMAQLILATVTLALWRAGTPTPVVVLAALLTGGAVLVSRGIWHGRAVR